MRVLAVIILSLPLMGCQGVGNLIEHRALEAACVYQDIRSEQNATENAEVQTLCDLMLQPPRPPAAEVEDDAPSS